MVKSIVSTPVGPVSSTSTTYARSLNGSASCDTKRTSATSCVDAGASKLYDSVVGTFAAPARRRAMCVPVSGNSDCPRLLDVLRTTRTSAAELATKGTSKPFSKPLSMHRTGPSAVGIAVRVGLEVSVAVWVLFEVPVPDAVCDDDGEDVCDDDGVAVFEGLDVIELVGVRVSVELGDVVPVDVADEVSELVGVMLDVAVTLELALEVALTEAVAEAVSLADTDAVFVALAEGVIVEVDDVVAVAVKVELAVGDAVEDDDAVMVALHDALAEGVTVAVDDVVVVGDRVGDWEAT